MISTKIRTRAALVIYFVIGSVDIIIGVTYFSSNEFMSYHSQAIGAPWQAVNSGTQTIILALMKVAGGGWIALGFFTITLALTAFKTSSTVVRWTLPVGTIIFWFACFTATWGVYQETGAPTPWEQSLVIIGLALLALITDAPWSWRGREPN